MKSNVALTETKELQNHSCDSETTKTNLSTISVTQELIRVPEIDHDLSVTVNNCDEASIDKQKSYNRDSGFHTMTRHPHADKSIENLSSTSTINGSVTHQNCSGGVNDHLSSSMKNDFCADYRDRSSPVVHKRSMKFMYETVKEEANDLALKLFNLEGKDKQEVAKHLSNKDDFSLNVAKKYMELFDFTNVHLDEAMRLLLKKLALLGETQERERILQHFACRYNQCNPTFLNGDLDVVHLLVCAIALLNTDLHGTKVGGRKRMTKKQFIANFAGVTKEGQDIPSAILKDMYRSISKNPLPWCEQSSDKPSTSITKSPSLLADGKRNKSQVVSRSQSMNQPGHHKLRPLPVFPDTDGKKVGNSRANKFKTVPKKQGVLWRKPIIECDGSKTPKRKRRWKLVVVVLQGLEFHIAKKNSNDATKVSLHHSLAEVDDSHSFTKRDNVFRLELANRSVALYQTNLHDEHNEHKQWAREINRNAALLSAAPLSAGVGSQVRFQRPLLPSASSTLPLGKQLEEQQNRLDALCNELDELQSNSIRDDATSAEKQYRKDKEDYLNHEIHKYEVYTNSLRVLVTAERQFSTQSQDLNASANRRSADVQSLLSVSPSEPGVGQNLSSYPSTEDTESVGDLLERDKPKHTLRLRAVTSPLNPTSSLPNLQPQPEHPHFDFSTVRRGSKKEKNLSRFDSNSKGSLPAVDETDSLTDASLTNPEPLKSLNENNCNNKSVHGHARVTHSIITKQSSFVGTSYLLKDVVRREAVKRNVDSSDSFSSLSRVKGRKERKGSSRYSYLHAVHDSTQM